MNCNCKNCCNIISATSVTTSGGVTTITIPSGTTFVDGKCYCIGLFIDIPSGTNGTQVNITDGTTTYTIFNRLANYWKPFCALRKRSVLKVKYFGNPSHFFIG